MDDPLPDRFQEPQLIGRGAAADVYRAHDAALNRPVAVKVFRPGHDRIALRRFAEESRVLASLSHPGLVSVFSCGVHADRPYLVMRLVEGETLQSRLLGEPLSLDGVVELGAMLADALAYVHRHRIVHRDVKPSNILLDTAGAPCLGDFGIALTADGTRMTRTNEIVGTPAYLAPEQVLGDEVGPAADVYSLGLTLVECLTGVTEYRAANEVATAVARLHRAPRLPEGLPPWLATLLRAMTDKTPELRPTAGQCAQELRAKHEPVPVGTAVIVPHRSWLTRSVAATTAVAAAVIGLILTLHTISATPGRPVARVADNQAHSVTSSAAQSRTSPPPTVSTPGHPAAVVAVPPVQPATGNPGKGSAGGPPHSGADHPGKHQHDQPGPGTRNTKLGHPPAQ